jgi:hypothetical protein
MIAGPRIRWRLALAVAGALLVGVVAMVPNNAGASAVGTPSQLASVNNAPMVAAPANGAAVPADSAANPKDTKTACVYSHHSIRALEAFGQLVGRDFACALVYNNAATDWADWESPWFTHQKIPDSDWSLWATSVPGRMLVISQDMRPTVAPADWAYEGAAGAYDGYARTLAQNLVNAGLGSSIIRLGFEDNGTWMDDSLGTTQADWTAWSTYWARIVTAMRQVPGGHFEFDWTINAGYRNIPLADYYPGDAFVDIIGIDTYDALPGNPTYASPRARWTALYAQPSGLGQVITFAHAHAKPLSVPEWGLVNTGPNGGAGDDPAYVDGIAAVVRANVVRYQSIFLNTTGGTMLISQAPQSLARYQGDFGGVTG